MSVELLLRDESLGPRSMAASVRIRNSLARAHRMIEDMLDFTRTRMGSRLPIAPAKIELCAVAQQVVEELRAFHPNRQIHLERSAEVWGTWDTGRIAQMLSNLAGNAIQHGEPGRPVRIRLEVQQDAAQVHIHNEGPPIAPDKIFDPLVRAVVQESEDRNDSSSVGLGLYIAREIAVAHGGAIHVESSREEGTTFTATLPRNEELPAKAGS